MQKKKYNKPLLMKVLLDNSISLALSSYDEGDLPPTFESHNNKNQVSKIFYS
jgi:hypothetical protein